MWYNDVVKGTKEKHMKLNVVDIPDYIIGGKKIDEAALIAQECGDL